MSDIAIRVSDLSKAYRIGLKEQRHETFTGALVAMLKAPFSNYSKLKNLSRIKSGDESEDIFWALQNVSFEVKRGEVIGVIGKNGAGKSTLLKILSQITEPTQGKIEIFGRVASLLEVGTGFNPELTGRENTYLNGAILGMTRKEIDGKFEEIVEFSGIEKFIDTPVKRYSSGMRVRLAFSVAAHLDPEILIIDEVLAVGDAEFQKKCLGKMGDVAQKEGRTVLFVSHNMGAVKNLCTKGISLMKGKLEYFGDVDTAISQYLNFGNSDRVTSHKFTPDKQLPLVIESVELLKNGVKADTTIFDFQDSIGFSLTLDCREVCKNRGIVIHCHDSMDQLFSCFDISVDESLLVERKPGKYKLKINFPSPIFKAGVYNFDFEVGFFGKGPEQLEKNILSVEVDILSRNPRFQSATANRPGKYYIEPTWEYTKI